MTTSTSEGAQLDPALVPVFPCVRLELRPCAEGFEGLVDGERVAAGDELELVRAEVMAAAAGVAARREGSTRAVRARGTGVDGAVFDLVVTADGEVIDVPAGRAHAAVSAAGTRRGRGRWPWVVAVCAGLLLVVGLLGVAVHRVGVDRAAAGMSRVSAPPAPTPTQLPVVAPVGWSAQAGWSTATSVTGAGSGSSVASDGARVFVVGGSSVRAVRARDGVPVWSAKVDGAVQTGPSVTMLGGRPVVVAATSDRLYGWAPSTGAPVVSAGLPAGSSGIQVTATGVLVGEQGQHVGVLTTAGVVSRVVPAGAVAYAPTTSAAVVAVDGAGRVWTVTSARVAGAAGRLAAPAGTVFSGVAGCTTRVLVAVYATAHGAGQQVVLRGFTLGSWAPVWTSAAVPVSRTVPAAMTLAPSGSWGVYGSTVVDLASGRTAGLPVDWQSGGLGTSIGFGTTTGLVATITPVGLTASSAAAVRAAEQAHSTAASTGGLVAPQVVGTGAAFLLASDGSTSHVYALRAATSSATQPPAPSPTSTPASSPHPSSSRATARPRPTSSPTVHRSHTSRRSHRSTSSKPSGTAKVKRRGGRR